MEPGNPKGELISTCRALELGEPVFESVAQGPRHAPWFSAVVRLEGPLGGREPGRGEGASKRDAERQASSAALRQLTARPAADGEAVGESWPVYAEVLSQALLVAHERGEAQTLAELRRQTAELYRELLRELGVQPQYSPRQDDDE